MAFFKARTPKPTPTPTVALLPLPHVERPDQHARGGAPTGLILERARKRMGYSPAAVCRILLISERDLNNYEGGLRALPISLIERFAELYDIDPERLQPGAVTGLVAPTSSVEHKRFMIGWASVDLDAIGTSNHERLRAVAQTIRSMRGLSETMAVTVRDDEKAAFVEILDVDAPDLHDDLVRFFSLGDDQATELLWRLRDAAS